MKKIPCVMMRGGTSRGAFLLAEHLPEDQTQRDKILMAIMGSGNDREIDSIGGGNPLTSKVAIISRSSDPHADVDYLFAQVIVHEQRVDTTPNCGNMLSGVGAPNEEIISFLRGLYCNPTVLTKASAYRLWLTWLHTLAISRSVGE